MKKLFAALAALAMGIIPALAFAQFDPGNEGASSGGVGGATMLTIKQVAPGKVVFVTVSNNAIYKGAVPGNVKAHYSDKSESGDGGTDYVVDVASNAALANQQLCWRGVGGDWNKMACAPLMKGATEVAISVGSARDKTFALVPIVADNSKRQLAWAAHPENTKVLLACPGMKHPDMASVFRVDADGNIRVATKDEVKAYEVDKYATFCRR